MQGLKKKIILKQRDRLMALIILNLICPNSKIYGKNVNNILKKMLRLISNRFNKYMNQL